MKQVIQNLSSGETSLIECPAPVPAPGQVLVRSEVSLISAGTERMLVEFGQANLLSKARAQPDKVRMVIDKVRTDGLRATTEAVRSKLEQPIPLGYCNAGTVIALGEGVSRFNVGDRVASNGSHAELVRVPASLCAAIPQGVTSEAASFTVLASIGLQGIRLAAPTLGESVAVIGAGLIGLTTVQLLQTQGCRVLAIDFDDAKLALARQFGAITCNAGSGEDPIAVAAAFSRGRGIDAVLITASTKSSDPVSQAAQMSRKRGRIVLVGVTGLELQRSEFYEKELSFQVSCSYGPGRYDPAYEEQGHDYPAAFVRWTENRNFEAVLDMLTRGTLDTGPLVSARYAFDQAQSAYQRLSTDRSVLGLVLEYPHLATEEPTVPVRTLVLHNGPAAAPALTKEKVKCTFIGAGNYASRVLIPAFRKADVELRTLVTSGGLSAAIQGGKNGFHIASTDIDEALADTETNAVVIATRHDQHADMTLRALAAGKHVFVEKPLAITNGELDELIAFHSRPVSVRPLLMVGYNRRFAPQVTTVKDRLQSVSEPKVFIMTMNAGDIPGDHWTQDTAVGGGRIIGEACHLIDLMRYLAGAPIVTVHARRVGDGAGFETVEDKATITLGFEDGSMGTIHYLANGHSAFPKERIEVFAAGKVLQIDNFLRLNGFGWRGLQHRRLFRQDKGQIACARAFVAAIREAHPAPIPVDQIFEVARVTIDAADQLRAQT